MSGTRMTSKASDSHRRIGGDFIRSGRHKTKKNATQTPS
jgi:hypothetical protein